MTPNRKAYLYCWLSFAIAAAYMVVVNQGEEQSSRMGKVMGSLPDSHTEFCDLEQII